jgi:flagellar biosynthesis protein FliQ
MTSPEVLDVARDAIWLTIAMSAPAMLVGLVVGLIIGLFQALTQIQEMTLVFVPKILAIFAALIIFMPFMGALMGDFMGQIMQRVASGSGL